MAVSNLTQLTQSQYQELGITDFPNPPVESTIGNPDNRISVKLGGWVGTSVLAFTVENQASANSSLTIQNSSTNVLNANVVRSPNPTASISYWTVNMGAGASGTNWEISVNVSDGTVNTGTWVFVKGKSIKTVRRIRDGKSTASKTKSGTTKKAKAGSLKAKKKTPAKSVKKTAKATPKKKGITKKVKASKSRTVKKRPKKTAKKTTRKVVKKGR